jgi:tRNA modification GTPase
MIPAQRGVLRCSGDLLFEHLAPWFEKYANGFKPAEKRSIQHFECDLFDGVSIETTVVVFCAPHSATGENVVEFHLPGNPVVLQRLEQSLAEFGLEVAEPGEFTRRAFLNGRLDLSQAEAVLELVQSRSAESARAASQLLSGGLSQQMSDVRHELMTSLVELEAGLDFEEGDSQDLRPSEVIEHVKRAKQILQDAAVGQQTRALTTGARFGCLLLGPPNAGKTSLFAHLTGMPSLVSDQAGTTRDYRRAALMSSSVDIDLIDFPGLGGDAVDQRDALARELVAEFDQADICLLCLHPNTKPDELPSCFPNMPKLVVFTHSDLELQVNRKLIHELRLRLGNYSMVSLSSHGDSAATSAALSEAITPFFDEAEKVITQRIRNSERYQLALGSASAAVEKAEQWLEVGGQQDLVAAEIHHALAALAELVGEMTPDDLLDSLFSAFCVGK